MNGFFWDMFNKCSMGEVSSSDHFSWSCCRLEEHCWVSPLLSTVIHGVSFCQLPEEESAWSPTQSWNLLPGLRCFVPLASPWAVSACASFPCSSVPHSLTCTKEEENMWMWRGASTIHGVVLTIFGLSSAEPWCDVCAISVIMLLSPQNCAMPSTHVIRSAMLSAYGCYMLHLLCPTTHCR